MESTGNRTMASAKYAMLFIAFNSDGKIMDIINADSVTTKNGKLNALCQSIADRWIYAGGWITYGPTATLGKQFKTA